MRTQGRRRVYGSDWGEMGGGVHAGSTWGRVRGRQVGYHQGGPKDSGEDGRSVLTPVPPCG